MRRVRGRGRAGFRVVARAGETRGTKGHDARGGKRWRAVRLL